MRIDVRVARPDDAEDVAAAHVQSWRVGYRHVFTKAVLYADDFESSRRAMWRRVLSEPPPGMTTWVVVLDGQVVGFANIGPERERDDAPACRAEVWAFYLHPDSWGSGCASALMTAAVDDLLDRGYTEVILWVLEDNPRGRAFYEKVGWRLTGASATFDRYCDQPVPEVEYVRPLG